MAAVALRYEKGIFGDHSLFYLQVRFKMLAYVVVRPCAYFTTQNVLSRKNEHFKMVLNMGT